MTAAAAGRRRLLVEGATDKRTIPQILERLGVAWEPAPKQYAAHVEAYGGLSELVAGLPVELKSARASDILGVVVDADSDLAARWDCLRRPLSDAGLETPPRLPRSGFIGVSAKGTRVGVWIMPDNQSPGMLETFLAELAPRESELWQHVESSTDHAQGIGAAWKAPHRDKALVHTYLAWMHPAGRQLHEAVRDGVLRPKSEAAARFVEWFRGLFAL